jgi:hypothetical protein
MTFLVAVCACGGIAGQGERDAGVAGSGGDVGGSTAVGLGGTGNTAGNYGGASGGSGGSAGSKIRGTGGTSGTVTLPQDSGAAQDCSNMPKAPTLGSCVQPVGGWRDGSAIDVKRSVEFGGTIISVAKGPVANGCFTSPSVDASSEIVALIVRASADGGTADWNVEYQVPSNGVNWTVGENIQVAYARSGGGWVPVVTSLILNFGQAVDVYIGSGGKVSDLGTVPFTFRQGASVCVQHHMCGDWADYDLEFKDTSGWIRVPYGATTTLGTYRIIHGGLAEQLTASSTCADWYVADVHVAVMRDTM